jgi:hypothetical protein
MCVCRNTWCGECMYVEIPDEVYVCMYVCRNSRWGVCMYVEIVDEVYAYAYSVDRMYACLYTYIESSRYACNQLPIHTSPWSNTGSITFEKMPRGSFHSFSPWYWSSSPTSTWINRHSSRSNQLGSPSNFSHKFFWSKEQKCISDAFACLQRHRSMPSIRSRHLLFSFCRDLFLSIRALIAMHVHCRRTPSSSAAAAREEEEDSWGGWLVWPPEYHSHPFLCIMSGMSDSSKQNLSNSFSRSMLSKAIYMTRFWRCREITRTLPLQQSHNGIRLGPVGRCAENWRNATLA